MAPATGKQVLILTVGTQDVQFVCRELTAALPVRDKVREIHQKLLELRHPFEFHDQSLPRAKERVDLKDGNWHPPALLRNGQHGPLLLTPIFDSVFAELDKAHWSPDRILILETRRDPRPGPAGGDEAGDPAGTEPIAAGSVLRQRALETWPHLGKNEVNLVPCAEGTDEVKGRYEAHDEIDVSHAVAERTAAAIARHLRGASSVRIADDSGIPDIKVLVRMIVAALMEERDWKVVSPGERHCTEEKGLPPTRVWRARGDVLRLVRDSEFAAAARACVGIAEPWAAATQAFGAYLGDRRRELDDRLSEIPEQHRGPFRRLAESRSQALRCALSFELAWRRRVMLEAAECAYALADIAVLEAVILASEEKLPGVVVEAHPLCRQMRSSPPTAFIGVPVAAPGAGTILSHFARKNGEVLPHILYYANLSPRTMREAAELQAYIGESRAPALVAYASAVDPPRGTRPLRPPRPLRSPIVELRNLLQHVGSITPEQQEGLEAQLQEELAMSAGTPLSSPLVTGLLAALGQGGAAELLQQVTDAIAALVAREVEPWG